MSDAYKREDDEDRRYKKGDKEKQRTEFKKDVADAVKPVVEKAKPKKQRGGKHNYAQWSIGALRKHLGAKKMALLEKNGFPGGKVPRGKAAMVTLCAKLKRKRF